MTLAAGTRFGPYQILAHIGAGGMGEVYRGVDTRLDRPVAIKILPPHLSENPALRERFEREARAISAISHPHICTLFDVGRHDDTDYLVMEYLEGESLADRIARGPLPIDQTLRYGVQIAEALDKAHRQGVIHRDLKPGNIMITKSGVKLLDFGLAKFGQPSSAQRSSSSPVRAGELTREKETVHKPLTEEGTVLGTYQYMAPEQLEGLEADARTDIFALGAVLYEMVTGHRAFEGKNRTSLIAAIVSGEPAPISSLQPLSPPALERVVKSCLAKDPEDRWQTGHDVALELKWISSEHSQPAARAERSPWRRLQRRIPWIVAVLAVALAGTLALRSSGPAGPSRQVRSRLTFPPEAQLGSFSVSPDGERIAAFLFMPGEKNLINIRSLDGVEQRDIAGPPNPSNIFWAPDGRSIGFISDRRLMKMDLSGGPAQEICRADYGVGATWTQNNTVVFAPRFGAGLFRVSADGGTPEPLTQLDLKARESIHGWPAAVPGTDLVLFLRRTTPSERNQIHAISTRGGTAVKIMDADALSGATKRHIYFVRDGGLFRQSFDPRARKVEGKPERLADQVFYSEVWAAALVSVDRMGSTVAYEQYRPRRITLRRLDRSGKDAGGPYPTRDLDTAQLSRDDRFLVGERFEPRHGATDIWMVDLARNIEVRLTNSPAEDEDPQWTPDGRSIFFNSDLDGLYEPYIVPANGSSEPRRLLGHKGDDTFLRDWSRDGRTLLLEVSNAKTSNDIWTAPASDPQRATLYLGTAANEEDSRFSPDGKWIVYVSNASGRQEVYVQSYPRSEVRHQISTNGGTGPRWSPNGNEVFYLAGEAIMAVEMKRHGSDLEPGVPRTLFTLPRQPLDTAYEPNADGKTFLISAPAEPPPDEIYLISTWPPPDRF